MDPEALLQHVGNQETSEEVLPFSELHRVAIQSFANARPFLNTNCEDVLVVLGQLALSCFEQLLSADEDESLFRLCQSIQDSHRTLLEFLDNSFEILADISRQGIWKNPVLVKILSHQSVEPEEVNQLIQHEGVSFLQMRIRHLMKTQRLSQAAFLSRLCTESTEIADVSPFLQSYITCLCLMPLNEESIIEISKVDGEEVLEMISNLEAEGQVGIAFVLCTIYFTLQLHTENVYCSWELTLLWSKLQLSIEPSLDLFIERCRQFGIIARTLPHLLFLIKVLQSEAEDAGIGVGIFLCVRALQIQANEYNDMKTYICKIIAYLLPEDLEVRRACQLTEYLLQPSEEGYSQLEALHIQPDQQFGEQNAPIPNSLRCELLLALKAYWPFDPEFWDWKTLRRHCLKLLGKDVSESEDDLSINEVLSLNETELLDSLPSDCEESREENNFDNVSQDGVTSPLNLEALENKESPDQQENLSLPSGSTEREQALVVKQEPLSGGEEGGQNNGSFKSHALLLASENSTTSVTDAMDCGQSISEAVLPQEKACLPSSLEERDSNTAVYFDGEKFTCGFEGCRSRCKHSKRVQKLLRRIHPYHFIPRRKNKDIRQLESPMEEMSSDSPDIGDCNNFCSSGNCLMDISVAQNLFAGESFEDMNVCAEDVLNSTEDSMSIFNISLDRELEHKMKHHGVLRGTKRKGGDLDDEEGLKGLKYPRLSPPDRSVKRRPVRGLRERWSIRNKGKHMPSERGWKP